MSVIMTSGGGDQVTAKDELASLFNEMSTSKVKLSAVGLSALSKKAHI